MSTSDLPDGAAEPLRFRPAQRRRGLLVGTVAVLVLEIASLVYQVVRHASVLEYVGPAVLVLFFGWQLGRLLTLTTVDRTGVHTRWGTKPWGDVRGVRVSRWADAVVLELEGGKQRQLGLPAADGERVAALAGVPLVNPPRL